MASESHKPLNSVEFPGQGAPYGELVKELSDIDLVGREAHEIAVGVFEEVHEATGIDVQKESNERTVEELSDTRIAQLLLLAAGMAGGSILLKKGVKPDYLRGHSASAYTAASVAGALTLKKASELVRERGKLMHEGAKNHPGGIAITDLSIDPLRVICKKAGVHLANMNSPLQTVISGETVPLAKAKALIRKAGARATVLRDWTNGPVHSPLFDEEEIKLRLLLDEVDKKDIDDPKIPIVRNVDAKVASSANEVIDDLGAMAQPVMWTDGTLALLAKGVKQFIEVSPSKRRILAGFLKDHGLVEGESIKHLFDFL
jgi:[acyl-carrier-protein] S-malonyltransferase